MMFCHTKGPFDLGDSAALGPQPGVSMSAFSLFLKSYRCVDRGVTNKVPADTTKDKILDLFLVAAVLKPLAPGQIKRHVDIDHNFDSPLGLGIDRRSRKEFAEFYYSNFVFDTWTTDHCGLWIKTVDKKYRDMIKTIKQVCLTVLGRPTTDGICFSLKLFQRYSGITFGAPGGAPGAVIMDASVFVFRVTMKTNNEWNHIGLYRGDYTKYVEDSGVMSVLRDDKVW